MAITLPPYSRACPVPRSPLQFAYLPGTAAPSDPRARAFLIPLWAFRKARKRALELFHSPALQSRLHPPWPDLHRRPAKIAGRLVPDALVPPTVPLPETEQRALLAK